MSPAEVPAEDGIFLPALRDELSQGDVVDVCPVGAVPRLRVARTYQDAKPPDAKAIVYDYPLPSGVRSPAPALFKRDPDTPLFEARLRRCIIVSNDCVTIYKEENRAMTLGLKGNERQWPWHVAPLEAWPDASQTVKTPQGDLAMGDLIEAGRFHRYLPLPPAPSVPKSYIDLRYITPLRPEVLETITRIASLSDFGQALLASGVFRYFSGRVLPSHVQCPSCGTRIPVSEASPADAGAEGA